MADDVTSGEAPTAVSFDMNKFLSSILAQNGGNERAALRQLGKENLRIRNKYQSVRKENETLKGQLPGKDAVVLVGDEAKEYQSLKERKLTAKDIFDAIAERDTLRGNVTEMQRKDAVNRAATIYEDVKYRPSILLDQLNGRDMEISFRKVKIKDEAGNEDEHELPHVRKRGDDKGQWTELKPYVDKELKEYKPALEVSEADTAGTQERRMTPVPGSSPSAPGKARGSRDIVNDHIAASYSFPGDNGDKK
jgi:hypothetical protein